MSVDCQPTPDLSNHGMATKHAYIACNAQNRLTVRLNKIESKHINDDWNYLLQITANDNHDVHDDDNW